MSAKKTKVVKAVKADGVKIKSEGIKKEVNGLNAVRAEDVRTGKDSVVDNTSSKTAQEYTQESNFKEITDSGIKEVIVDKERLQLVPHELTGKPVFETSEEYQKHLAGKEGK